MNDFNLEQKEKKLIDKYFPHIDAIFKELKIDGGTALRGGTL